MAMAGNTSLVFFLFLSSLSITSAIHVLLVPGPLAGSRLNLMNFLAEKLAARDQNITIFVNEIDEANKVGLKLVRYEEASDSDVRDILPRVTTQNINWKELSSPENVDELMSLEGAWCRVVLGEDVSRRWQEEGYDVAVVDSSVNLCVMGLLHTLHIPYIIFYSSTFGISHPADPAMSSYVPAYGTSYTDHMRFPERFHNFVMANLWGKYVRAHFYEAAQAVFDDRYPQLKVDLEDVSKEAALMLLNTDYTLEYIRPLPPSIIMVGGFHCQQKLPLPKDLDEWMSGSVSGVVILALGTVADLSTAPDDVILPLIHAFNHLTSFRFIILSKSGITAPVVGSNIRVLTWINLQALLAHTKTRLFINHGGSSSSLEAICHGIPVLGLPIFDDNLKNLVVLRSHGMAEILSKNNLTSDVVVDAINRIVAEPGYKDQALEQAMLLRDQPLSPINRAIYWVEYVARHRGAHNLRCAALDLTVVERYQLDVWALLVGVPTLVTFLMLLLLPRSTSPPAPTTTHHLPPDTTVTAHWEASATPKEEHKKSPKRRTK